jgi:sirohydrochlorin ferrochelatase
MTPMSPRSLILTAHGSADPRAAVNTHAVADEIRRQRPSLDVRVAFCEQSTPNLRDVVSNAGDDAVVTPLLLADAYHARVDIPAMIAGSGAAQADVLGEDDRLVAVLRHRVRELGLSRRDPDVGVAVVAVGSSRAQANARTAAVAPAVAAGTRWAGAVTTFATGPQPSLAEATQRLRAMGARRLVIAPWFLAHGRITDRVAKFAVAQDIQMAEPLGAHRLVAATVLERFDRARDQADRLAA